MKRRVTFAMDPAVSRGAKTLAHARGTSVSALVEELVRSVTMTQDRDRSSFVKRWAGQFKTATTEPGDQPQVREGPRPHHRAVSVVTSRPRHPVKTDATARDPARLVPRCTAGIDRGTS